MKKKFLVIFGTFVLLTFVTINLSIAFNLNDSSNISLLSLTKAMAADETPYDYEVCVQDDCSIAVGFPPYVITYSGHYLHCITGPGYCQDCPGGCDAL